MGQSLPPDSDPQLPAPEPSIRQQTENSTMDGGMQAAKGNNNIQSQGNNNWIGNTWNNFWGWQEPARARIRPDNQRSLLAEVKNEVTVRLKSSLHNAILINLQKEQQSYQVKQPWDAEIKIGKKPSSPLPDTTSIIEVFDQEEIVGKLLILGSPGSGKTTTQLELAQALIRRAEEQASYPIPVLFNLSSWKNDRQPITEWLGVELKSKYGVRSDIGKEWMENRQLLLVLDGLDELDPARQEPCVRAINQLLQGECRPQYLIVCSRREEYTNYETRLHLNGAIYLQALTEKQIQEYLTTINHAELWQKISKDRCLLELTKIPLLLSIVVLAYQEIFISSWENMTEERWHNMTTEEWTQIPSSSSFNLQDLLDAYIRRMLTREIDSRAYIKQKPPIARQTRLWLIWLAQQLQRESKTEFLIEEIQPSWLRTRAEKRLYRLIAGLSYVLIAGLSYGLIAGLSFKPVFGLIAGLIAGLFFALDVWLFEEIKTIEILTWSWKKPKSKIEMIYGLTIGVACGLIYALRFNLSIGLIVGLFFVLFYWLTRGALNWSSDIDIETKIIPNQGIWKSAVNGGILALIGGLSGGLMGGLVSSGLGNGGLIGGLIGGLSGGLSGGLGTGGRACIQHFVLRLILYRNGYIPWNYARFLNYATECLLLQRVGGRYQFIHKLLQDHFAQMQLNKSR